MVGVVAQYANYQKHYDLIKSGVVGGVQKEVVEKVQTTENIQEYLGDGVYISFNGEDIENEKNFMDGATDKSIDSENIEVCLQSLGLSFKEESFSEISEKIKKLPIEVLHLSTRALNVLEKENIGF